ncbi:transferrin-binding protein-like solute binding protein [Pontibaca methylaminivorans]|uniref:transferrin-binding protein-like solute binding protein n=1 Tax=Pontibaca methylaminivorans TaxID=515897 RepID=UPI002FD93072
MRISFVVAAVGSLGMVACGGGSSGSSGPVTPVDPSSFAGLVATTDSIVSEHPTGWDDLSPASAVEEHGTATYRGAATYSTDGDFTNPIAASNVTVEAIIGGDDLVEPNSGSITGSLDNFRDASNNPIAGQIDLVNGTIAGNTISASMEGEINGHSVNIDKDAEGGFRGGFRGDEAEAISGPIDGSVDGTRYYGQFGAER